jgi:GTP-binding protein
VAAFVDEAQVHLKAGDGGAGAVAFRREAHVAKGGPDGGNGGKGGDIFLEASLRAASLLAFKDHPHRKADSGGHGSGSKRHGRNGEDLVVAVPAGTVVRTLDGEILADLAHPGDRLLAATGGRGGRGNASFLSNRLRAPGFAEQGEFGTERWLDLELKLLADVALVGFPNVGKSTLISRISAAKPKIADYPFTTLEPNLGVVRAGTGATASEFTVADIPGLIEGASEGRGLGFQFLRHIERARVLLVLADLSPLAERPPAEQVEVLLGELERYRPELVSRPRLVIGSRADIADADVASPYQSVSAVTGEGVNTLIRQLAELVEAARLVEEEAPVEPTLHRPTEETFFVTRSGQGFVVEGRQAVRAVAVTDLNDPDALALVQRRLRRLGVDRALARAGARAGDSVSIGELEFEWEPES